MSRGSFRLPPHGDRFLDLFSGGRAGPSASSGFGRAQLEQIRRTVAKTPEVMVKVTGGGQTPGAVAAHLFYLSHHGKLDLETDEGQRVSRQEQKAMLKDWHLELSSGQYRGPPGLGKSGRPVKLVHNVVLSMPAPTSAEKVLAAARNFAREKFGLQHRYAMALHTHQPHPHVHLAVKGEGVSGQRLHIDKAGTICDPARAKLLDTRRAIMQGWNQVATVLDAQGEVVLAGAVRHFAMRLPRVMTDRERLAAQLLQHVRSGGELRKELTERAR